MKRSIVLSGNRLAVFAVVLAAVVLGAALAIGHKVRAAETAAAVESITSDSSQVSAGELAQWIVEKRQDYQLIDLRDPWQFDDYHIPTAMNIPFAQLLGNENRLDKNRKIVVYGVGAGRSAQAQLLLAMKHYRAYALNDGLIAWWDEIMTPTSIRTANPQPSGYQQARQLREYFMTGSRPIEPSTTVAAPVPQPVPVPAPAKTVKKSATKPAVKPAAKPAEPPPPGDKDKDRLKLGTGCS